MKPKTEVIIFTDGSCLGNPGPGGYAALLRTQDTCRESEVVGGEPNTTNNRMELMAAIAGLERLSRGCRVTVVSDSQYVVKGMNEGMPKWLRTNRLARLKNADLWQRLLDAAKPHQVTFQWVRGHNGHPENERVDRLANEAAHKAKRGAA